MKRILIEKRDSVDSEAKALYTEFKDYLGIRSLDNVRIVNSYEIYGATDDEVDKIVEMVLYEPALDILNQGMPFIDEDEKAFRVENIRGQYNQREVSANELVNKYLGYPQVKVQHSKYIIIKNISDADFEKIKTYYINPTESREIPLDKESYFEEEDVDDKVEIVDGFIDLNKEDLEKLLKSLGLAMNLEDLKFCQDYFKKANRNPTVTELKVIDTYWSDHCRHKTFNTEITQIEIEEGKYKEVFEKALKEYLASRQYVYQDNPKPITLMDMATINMKEIKKKGMLDDKEESEEVNAASIEVDVDHNGKTEKWLLMFKNETHNHPTEIEPFGGAATCLGGAIRDPLSGRAYVYQAMRITGAADPRHRYEDTLPGKLPQRQITRTAMEGYSSYGYQIGNATGYVKEYYHEGFLAKRMELGALVAAVPKDWILRGTPKAGDLVVLIGGRTGRDGIGAAVGSSKEHTEEALEKSGTDVQKGNPIVERKIVRLFRNKDTTKLIKKCNDFGAGGVAVAVGELADGLIIDLDKVPLKYRGLRDWEIAISESQERMAVLIDRNNLEKFMALVEKEDLEGTVVAEVTDNNRVTMTWRGRTVLDLEGSFLNSGGIRNKAEVRIELPDDAIYLEREPEYIQDGDLKDNFLRNIGNLNIASQKGLVERFDSTYGSGTVLMPLGGKNKITPQEGMVAKIPVLDGETSTCSIMTCGYDPNICQWSPFHGGYYAVIESLAKIVALGGDFRKARLTFQEYFERLGEEPTKWSKPFSALLGAFMVQKNLDVPSIGGKDSMSGTFEDIDVPPSLISFAVVTENVKNIVSKEFKKSNSPVVVVNLNIDGKGLVDFAELKKNYIRIKELIDKGLVLSGSVVKFGGIARSISEMACGNGIGFEFDAHVLNRIFKPLYGSIILEISDNEDIVSLLDGLDYSLVGRTTDKEMISLGEASISLKEIMEEWQNPLKDIFPVYEEKVQVKEMLYKGGASTKKVRTISIGKPKVLVPVFTGTHGEYDTELRFIEAGADVETFVFKGLTRDKIEESIEELAKRVNQCQILVLANGFILGNEPEGGGKLINILFNHPKLKKALNEHINTKDGLVLGIGSGLSALIRLGLIDKGYVSRIDENSTSITSNLWDNFVSTIVDVKVVSNLSPWFSGMQVGDVYSVPIATREGRVIVGKDDLGAKGQIATQFTDINPTGSDLGIDSLTSPDGRVLGTVSLIDRIGQDIYKNVHIRGTHNIFESGVKYFK